MAGTITKLEYELREVNTINQHIPDEPEARLMFYLDCLCQIIEMDNPNSAKMKRFRSFQRFAILTQAELQELFKMCTLLRPDTLLDKCIFINNKLCGKYHYNFCDKSVVKDVLNVADSVDFGGKRRRVKKVMVIRKYCRGSWISKYFLKPLQLLGERLEKEAKIERKRQMKLAKQQDNRDTVMCCARCF